ncbi:MAG: endonuclease [Ignavibacteriaceae bacterium]|jgi:endonuclease I
MKVCVGSLLRNVGILLIIVFLSGNSIAQSGLPETNGAVSVKSNNENFNPQQTMGTNDYYEMAYKLYGTALRLALHNIIKGHTVVSYASLWTYFQSTDKKPNGKVWDMYSDIPGGTPPYEFTFITKQCGNYSSEGDCYNKEHSWPQSWFNELSPPVSDIFHIFPTDGKVNGMRGNWPYGNVSSPTWTSLNGSKLGPNTSPGYSGTAFEPIDAYKGDLARSSMYMSVRYYTEDAGWSTGAGTNKSDLLPWYANLLYSWSVRDTVSQKEIDRNNAIYGIQKNRNPFIDHPEFAAEIWETTMAPSVVSVKQMNTTSVLIDFSRYLDSTVTVDNQNFIFDNSIGNPSSIQWGVNNDISKILVTVPTLATGTTFSIQLKNLKSINNVAMNDTVVTFKTSGPTGINDKQEIPQRFMLQQNYPNPFNPSTVISWQLAVGSFATLKVYDVLGNEVAELVNNFLEAGNYNVEFNASLLSSGVYFYKLSVDDKSELKKLILIR